MSKKLDTTPDGMICSVCGEDKPLSHFMVFHHMSAEDKVFFISIHRYPNGNPRNDVCWECNSPYRCLQCNNVLPASDYRIGGRYCKYCKSKWRRPGANMRKFVKSSA